MMPNFNNMPTSHLVDLLAQETQKFTQLMMDKEFTPEYEECKRTIQCIQAAIESQNEIILTDTTPAFIPSDPAG